MQRMSRGWTQSQLQAQSHTVSPHRKNRNGIVEIFKENMLEATPKERRYTSVLDHT
jgi:hypothetical protein